MREFGTDNGREGVQNPENLEDVICTCPLTSDFCKCNLTLFTYICIHQVETNKGPQPRCLCPKHRTGLFCDRPNLCLGHCLNGGTCQFTRSASGEADGMWCHCKRFYEGDR